MFCCCWCWCYSFTNTRMIWVEVETKPARYQVTPDRKSLVVSSSLSAKTTTNSLFTHTQKWTVTPNWTCVQSVRLLCIRNDRPYTILNKNTKLKPSSFFILISRCFATGCRDCIHDRFHFCDPKRSLIGLCACVLTWSYHAVLHGLIWQFLTKFAKPLTSNSNNHAIFTAIRTANYTV